MFVIFRCISSGLGSVNSSLEQFPLRFCPSLVTIYSVVVVDSLPPFFAVLVSRQYVDMSRIRIEGLLAAFPKLVGTGKQHTYVETENVRYVYQPIEALYLLLVTNKQSNILEDLETLRLLSKLVSSS